MKKATLIKILAVDDEPQAMRLGSSIDVIISDYRMPGMNGIDFLTLACERQPHTLRILLTGQTPGKDVLASLKSGVVTTYIPKPWDNEQLLTLVKNWIADNTGG